MVTDMILIFGGAYQGKLAYALERPGLTENDVYACSEESAEMPGNKGIVYELDKWLLALVKAGIDTDEAVGRFIAENKGAIVICNDISCGVVPSDPTLRKWREATGRALAGIARASDEVTRVFCGIPGRIK